MWRIFFILSLCCCGSIEDLQMGEFKVSTYPPDGWNVYGSGVTWESDFDIQNGIGTIIAVANNGSFIDLTTSIAHGLEVGQWVRISGTTDYNGEYTIFNVGSSTEFSVLHPVYTSSQSGAYYSNLVGPDCIKFEDTTPAENPILYIDTPVAVKEGAIYSIEAVVQATSVAAGNTVGIAVNWYYGDGSYLSTSWIHTGVLPSASTWHRIAGVLTVPENARGAALVASKANTAFFVFLDDFNGKGMPIAFAAEQGSATSIPHNTITDIAFSTELYDYGSDFSTPTYTAPVDGVYQVSGTVQINKLGGFNGSSCYLYLDYNSGTRSYVCDKVNLLASGQTEVLSCSTHFLLNSGDTLKLRVIHFDNQTLYTSGDYSTRFSVAKVE